MPVAPLVTFDSEIDPDATNTLTNVQLLLWPFLIATTTERPGRRGTPLHVTRTVCHRPAAVLGECSVTL